ncbi:oxidoreductase [Micromonospora pisi]|uniref:Oxidoreductase n=1 Tax=Micromonospora pisi TaxID=589240 RepID=A0A495JSU4_9ACTN|nr:Gfo/Idh/MocA family oxidoreductase [Micromonospora pisi]RKR91921.1 oxidoreductase [Micromonospora pisi]
MSATGSAPVRGGGLDAAGLNADPVPVRVAVVGMGWATREIWLPLLRGRDAFRLTAVVDPDPSARATKELGTEVAVLADVGELDPATVDLAVVAVPNHLHCEVACRLLVKGIAVFVEKPVCLTSQEAFELARAEQTGGAMLLAGSAALYRADLRALRQVQNSIGRLQHVELAWVRARGVPAAGGWFTQRRYAGGGALVDLGAHLLDVGAELLGTTGIRRAIGTTSSHFINNQSWRAAWRKDKPADLDDVGLDVEDTAHGFLVTDEGVGISLRTSWASHEACDVTRIALEGSAGTAVLRTTFGFSPNRLPRPTLTVTRGGRCAQIPLPEEPVGAEYGRQLDDLSGMLRDPGNTGRAIIRAGWAIDALERIYGRSAPVVAEGSSDARVAHAT